MGGYALRRRRIHPFAQQVHRHGHVDRDDDRALPCVGGRTRQVGGHRRSVNGPKSMNAVELEFRHVSKRYGTATVVNELSFTVPAGKICVLVGPSGCGKTTSLKMVNRLVEPTSGEILIGGRDVMTQDPIELRRGIGYVIQQSGCCPISRSGTTSRPCRGCSAGTRSAYASASTS